MLEWDGNSYMNTQNPCDRAPLSDVSSLQGLLDFVVQGRYLALRIARLHHRAASRYEPYSVHKCSGKRYSELSGGRPGVPTGALIVLDVPPL